MLKKAHTAPIGPQIINAYEERKPINAPVKRKPQGLCWIQRCHTQTKGCQPRVSTYQSFMLWWSRGKAAALVRRPALWPSTSGKTLKGKTEKTGGHFFAGIVFKAVRKGESVVICFTKRYVPGELFAKIWLPLVCGWAGDRSWIVNCWYGGLCACRSFSIQRSLCELRWKLQPRCVIYK